MIVETHMVSHIDVMHGGSEKSVLSFMCDICPFKTTQKRYLNEHKRKRHDPDRIEEKIEDYTCQICSEVFPYTRWAQRSYIQHYRTAHDTVPPEYENKEKFLCEQCPLIFFTKYNERRNLIFSNSQVF